MTYTSYPFDNQDTSESQYSALFRELQDNGVVDSFGGTGLAVSANASAMSVTLAPGSAIVRGFFFNNDASATLAIGAAGAAVRYDAVILRMDPTANSIVPVVVANAGQIPALTQTATGIYEILLAVVTVPTSASTIAAGNVADRRAYVSSRMGIWTTANRPTAPRQHQMGVNTDNGGRIEQYVSGTGWTNRLRTHWGSGVAFPTVGISAGDSFFFTGACLMRYTGTAWRQSEDFAVSSRTTRDAIPTAVLHVGFRVWVTDQLMYHEWNGTLWEGTREILYYVGSMNTYSNTTVAGYQDVTYGIVPNLGIPYRIEGMWRQEIMSNNGRINMRMVEESANFEFGLTYGANTINTWDHVLLMATSPIYTGNKTIRFQLGPNAPGATWSASAFYQSALMVMRPERNTTNAYIPTVAT